MSRQITSPVQIIFAALLFECLQPLPGKALPPAEDIPEEVLRTEIILEGRSPINGKPLSAAEYEQLQAELQESALDSQNRLGYSTAYFFATD